MVAEEKLGKFQEENYNIKHIAYLFDLRTFHLPSVEDICLKNKIVKSTRILLKSMTQSAANLFNLFS
jgi:hypothetical protein